jgi:hypothetical protein
MALNFCHLYRGLHVVNDDGLILTITVHAAIDALSHFFLVLSKASIIVGIPANDLLRGFGSHCSHCYRLK